MFRRQRYLQIVTSAVLISAFWLNPAITRGQDLIAVSSITSGSVFLFRSVARGIKRVAQAVKPTRTKEQKAESAARVKRQYESIAKANPNKQRAKATDPTKVPTAKSLPAAEAAKVFAGVGEYYVDKKDYTNAIDTFRDALSLDANNTAAKLGLSEALSMKGNELLEQDKDTDAKASFEEALKFDPKNSAAYFGMGEVYANLNQTNEAIANYEKSLENDKGLTEIYVPLGILYFQTGQIAKADDLLSKAIVISPNTAETQFFLGLVRASQNKQDEALAAFNKATGIDANYAEAYSHAGDALVSLKRPQEAIDQYQKAIALKADMYDTLVGLGGAYYDTDKFTDAVATYNKAKKLKNDDWEVYAGLGDASLKANSFNDAVANYNLALTFLQRNKDFSKETAADLYSKVGFAIGQQCPINQAKFQACQWPSAIKALEKAVELNGGKPMDYTNLGWAYFNASRADRDDKRPADQQAKLALAKAALQKAIDANPPFLYSVLQNYGAVQLDLADYKGAVESLSKVVEKQPDWAFSHYALGSAYVMVTDYNNAATQFNAALAIDPNYVAALSSLGTVEVKRKNSKEAKRILDLLKAKDPRAAAQLEQEIRLAKFK
jgi:tetratricopeptide (TPR) repeat protein